MYFRHCVQSVVHVRRGNQQDGEWPRPNNAHPTRIKATLHGSLAYTEVGHATDRAVVLGLCGFLPATIDLDAVDATLELFERAVASSLLDIQDTISILIAISSWIVRRRYLAMRMVWSSKPTITAASCCCAGRISLSRAVSWSLVRDYRPREVQGQPTKKMSRTHLRQPLSSTLYIMQRSKVLVSSA